jgi:Fe-S cluster biogenesis protein NfuA
MVQKTSDASVDFVLEQIETMVGSEGGTLELVSLDEGSLKVQYTPGVNEDCPECVPTADQVRQFLTASLGIHAPYVSNIEVVE